MEKENIRIITAEKYEETKQYSQSRFLGLDKKIVLKVLEFEKKCDD